MWKLICRPQPSLHNGETVETELFLTIETVTDVGLDDCVPDKWRWLASCSFLQHLDGPDFVAKYPATKMRDCGAVVQFKRTHCWLVMGNALLRTRACHDADTLERPCALDFLREDEDHCRVDQVDVVYKYASEKQ
jgi:hypothetical protein